MRLLTIFIVLAMALVITACSEDKVEGYSKPAQQGAAQQSTGDTGQQMAADRPGMNAQGMDQQMGNSNMPAGHPGAGTSGAPAPLLKQELHPGGGKVLKVMHAGGYTYMEVDMDGKNTWAAATGMKVETGDQVKWQDGAVMQNFTSSTLHRTFDEILFVSNASVGQ